MSKTYEQEVMELYPPVGDILNFSEAVYALERELKKRMGSTATVIEARKGGKPNEYVILWADIDKDGTLIESNPTGSYHTHAMWIEDDPPSINMEWGHPNMNIKQAKNDFVSRIPRHDGVCMVD